MILADSTVLRPLYSYRPLRYLLAYALDLFVIALAIMMTLRFHGFYPLAIWIIAARQHAIAVLMHDGTHFLIFKNRKWNDFFTRYFLTLPVFMSLHHYRSLHFAHHRHTNDPVQDPDWVRRSKLPGWEFPITRRQMALLFIKDFFLVTLFETSGRLKEQVSAAEDSSSRHEKIKVALYYGAVAMLVIHFHAVLGFFLFWVLPALMPMKVIRRIRGIAEHHGIVPMPIAEREKPLRASRSVNASWWEKIFLSPWNVNFHLEHHLYPQVPFFELPKLNRLLLQHDDFRRTAAVYGGYGAVLRECTLNPRDFYSHIQSFELNHSKNSDILIVS